MNCNVPSHKKTVKALTPKVNVKRPEFDQCKYNLFQKQLSEYKIAFNKNKNTLLIRRIKCLAEKFSVLRKAFAYTAATCVMTVLVIGSVSAMNLRIGHEAIVNGYPVGVIDNKQTFEQIISNVEDSVTSILGQNVDKLGKPVYIMRLVFAKDLTTEYQIKQNLLSTYDEVTSAYAVYVNDQLTVAALDEQSAQNALNRIKAQYVESHPDATIEFVDNIEIKQEFVPVAYIKSEDGIIDELKRPSQQAQQYTVQPKDTLWDIAGRFGMSVDDLLCLNPQYSDMIKDGDVLNITKSVPLISVKISYVSDSVQPIPAENEQIRDDNLLAGKTEVIAESTDGKKRVVETIVKINDDIVERNVQSEEILQQPVAGKIKVGTLSPQKAKTGTGQLIRPAYGTISSRFGRRSRGYHTGVDFANPIGTPIAASDNGVVIKAGWYGGYGNMVEINHGNGIVTLYAHCSALLVKNGETVKKGQVIAKVGSTGNSTGPHLHFEVRKNGQPVDPMPYLK